MFILFLIGYRNTQSQTPTGEIYEFQIMPNKDTLKVIRSYSDFWFGISAGGNMNYYFGKFQYLINPQVTYDSLLNPLANYKGNYGYGLNFGFNFEYLPKGEFYGIGLNVNFVENRLMDMVGESENLAKKEYYDIKGLMNYISISPTFRYSLPWNDWYLYAGPVYEIRQTNRLKHYTRFENVAQISQNRNINIQNINNRLGLQFGLGFEFLVANVEDLFRIKMSPFVSVGMGEDVFGDQVYNNLAGTGTTSNPSINSITVQGGIRLKIGVDEIDYDTLRFDPHYIPASEAYASMMDDKGISVEGFIKRELIEVNSIDLVEKGQIKEEVREEPVFAKEQKEQGLIKKEEPKYVKSDVTANNPKVFNYATSSTTDLTADSKDFLTAVAEYMKANPKSEVHLMGHTDNVGTEVEKQKISVERAQIARRFLMSKGVQGNRIFAGGNGDRSPIADSRTAEGRRKNRRLEITVTPKK